MNNKDYLLSMKRETYQRDDFDAFLKKMRFSYDVPSIHVAGSNGKGSTSTYLSYMYVKGHSMPHNALYCNILKIKNWHVTFFSFYVYNIKTLGMHKVYACIQHAYTANDHNKSS